MNDKIQSVCSIFCMFLSYRSPANPVEILQTTQGLNACSSVRLGTGRRGEEYSFCLTISLVIREYLGTL